MSKKEKEVAPEQDNLKRLLKLAELLVEEKARQADLEVKLSELKELTMRLEREDIPTLMAECELSEIKLKSGKKITVKEEVDAKITDANKPKAFAWLLEHKFGGIIKTLVAVQFGKGEHDEALDIAQKLQKQYKDRTVQLDESVHPSTLKAFVKERMEKGEPVPADLFGVYPYSKAVITD